MVFNQQRIGALSRRSKRSPYSGWPTADDQHLDVRKRGSPRRDELALRFVRARERRRRPGQQRQ